MSDRMLNEEQLKRIFTEVVGDAKDGVTVAELKEVTDAMTELATSAALWELWTDGSVAIGWDRETDALIFRNKEA